MFIHSAHLFRIDQDYDEIVGEDEEDFMDALRKQLAEQLGVDPKQIQGMVIRRGSIIVEFTVVSESEEETPALQENFDKLTTDFEEGKIELVSLNTRFILMK